MQTKILSLIESLTNVGIGFVIAYLGALVIYPLVGMEQSTVKYFEVTVYFTILSIGRMYFLRRFFNGPFHLWLQRFRNVNKNSS